MSGFCVKIIIMKKNYNPKWHNDYYIKNRERILLRISNNQKLNKIKRKQYMKNYVTNRVATDPKFRLRRNMTAAIQHCLINKKHKKNWLDSVGYTFNELVKHLESKFDDKMNWENYGSYWWVDHIKPKCLFIYKSPEDEEFKKCWALNNLQPLERMENLHKAFKFD